jgi:hypothetical protein
MMRTTTPTSPLQDVRERVFRLSRPKMAAILAVPYGELYGCETGGRPVSRRIVAALNSLGQDGEAVKVATRQWMEARGAALRAVQTTPSAP